MRNRFGRFGVIALALLAAGCAGGSADTGTDADSDASASPDAVPSLEGDWTAPALAGAQGPPRIAFRAGEVRGHTGCNGFVGSYKLGPDGSLAIGPVASTKKFCEGEPGRSERRVLDALTRTARARVAGDALVLHDAGGASLLEWRRSSADR